MNPIAVVAVQTLVGADAAPWVLGMTVVATVPAVANDAVGDSKEGSDAIVVVEAVVVVFRTVETATLELPETVVAWFVHRTEVEFDSSGGNYKIVAVEVVEEDFAAPVIAVGFVLAVVV